MKINKIKPLILILSAVIAVSACNSKQKKAETKEAEVIPDNIVELRDDQIKMAGIDTGRVELRAMSGILKVNGTVSASPSNMAAVSVPLGGYVKSTTLIPGNPVAKGQALAVIENQQFIDIQQDYLDTKSRLEYAEAELKRHNELYKDDVYSQKNMQQTTVEYKSLKTRLRALEQKLGMLGINAASLSDDNIRSSITVTSPISGYIKSVNITLGKFVNPSDVLFEIVNTSNLYLELTLFEKDIDKVANGQKIRFLINNETEQHSAFIYQVGKSVNANKTYSVYAKIEGDCHNVLPGMYVNASVEASASVVTALPSESIVSFDDKDYVFALLTNKTEGGKPFTEYKMIQVTKGVTDQGYTQIMLPPGMDYKSLYFVTKGAYNLLSAKKNAGEMAC